jgi:hypothetical protein
MAILLRYLLRHIEPLYALAAVALAFSLLAPHLVARPHILVAPLIVLWGICLIEAHDGDKAPSGWLLVLMPLWANLHGSFVFGLGILGLFACDAAIRATPTGRSAVVRRWAVLGVGCLVGACLTPSGVSGLSFAFAVNDMSVALAQIGEWRSANFQRFGALELSLLIIAAVALNRGLRLSWLRIVVLLGLVHMALKHARHADLVALLAPLVLAKPVAEQWLLRCKEEKTSAFDRHFRALSRPASPLATGLVLLVLLSSAVVVREADRLRPSALISPEAALSAVRNAGIQGRVLNSYDFGGFLIFNGVPTFIDGRADLFGDRFLSEYLGAVALSSSLPAFLDRNGIQWTLLPPGLPAVQLLDHLPGWRRLHSDPVAIVHVRQP